jgi:hypothetical protein
MKLFLFLLLICCLHITDAAAQKKVKYKINPGEKILEKLPREEIYTYPEFIKGTVYLRNNTISIVPLNYNSVYAEMQFINPKGDTLSVADEKMIKLIVVNKDTFYYDKVCMKLIADQGKVKLANNEFFEITNREKIGEFGQPGRGSIETYNNISSKSYIKDIVANEIITMTKNNVFYIGDEFNNFRVVNKKNLMEMFANNQEEVKAYLKDNKVDLSNEKDLKKMIVYFKKMMPVQPL